MTAPIIKGLIGLRRHIFGGGRGTDGEMQNRDGEENMAMANGKSLNKSVNEIPTISLISPGTGYTGKPALPKIWAIKLGIWDEQYKADMLKNHPEMYNDF